MAPWRIIDLGVLLPGDESEALAINARGQVFGASGRADPFRRATLAWQDGRLSSLGRLEPLAINGEGKIVGSRFMNGALHAVVWRSGKVRDLGGLPGGRDTEATAINGQGDIVGWSTTTENIRHVVLWPSGGKIRDLGRPLGSEPSRSVGALMINDRRQIAGSAVTETQSSTGTVTTSYGFLWQNGQMTLLASPSRQTRVYDLNDKGQIVGSWRTSAGKWRGFLWQNGKLSDLGLLPDLPSTGISDAGTPFPGGPPDLEEATAINDRGQIIGYGMVLSGSDCPHGFLWQQGHMRDLGILFGAAGCTRPAAINNRGQIVGSSTNPDGIGHPFVWESGKLRELPSLGGESGAAVAINAGGQIVGSSTTSGHSQHAVLWSKTNFG